MAVIELHEDITALSDSDLPSMTPSQRDLSRIIKNLEQLQNANPNEIDFALHLMSSPRARFSDLDGIYLSNENIITASFKGKVVYVGKLIEN